MSSIERTLHRRCLDHVVPEHVQLIMDGDGEMHFATGVLPMRTIIDKNSLPFGRWVKLDGHAKTVTLACDGRTVVYQKVARDIHGFWICDKVSET